VAVLVGLGTTMTRSSIAVVLWFEKVVCHLHLFFLKRKIMKSITDALF